MAASAHRHYYVCGRCGAGVICTTLGIRWIDRDGNIKRRHEIEDRYHKVAGYYDGSLAKTNVHELGCARRYGEQPRREWCGSGLKRPV